MLNYVMSCMGLLVASGVVSPALVLCVLALSVLVARRLFMREN